MVKLKNSKKFQHQLTFQKVPTPIDLSNAKERVFVFYLLELFHQLVCLIRSVPRHVHHQT